MTAIPILEGLLDRLRAAVDIKPPGWLERRTGYGVARKQIPHEAPKLSRLEIQLLVDEIEDAPPEVNECDPYEATEWLRR